MRIRYSTRTLLALSIAACLVGCGDNESGVPPSPPKVTEPVPAFDSDGTLDAEITWTTYGVPHVKADNLESMAYGVGYAFALSLIHI